MAHLGLKRTDSIQYLDVKTGKWITLLAGSPGVPVSKGTVIHIKQTGCTVSTMSLIGVRPSVTPTNSVGRSQSQSPAKRKLSVGSTLDRGVTDLTSAPDTPITKRNRVDHNRSRCETPTPTNPTEIQLKTQNIGDRPAKLAEFPARTVGEMDVRFKWITKDDGSSSTRARYDVVFSRKFVNGTYYRHLGAWMWLRDNGRLAKADSSDLWKPLAHIAFVALKEDNGKEGNSGGTRKEVILVE